MKQKSVLCAALLLTVLVSGCGRQEKQLEYIGASKAKSLALEASGIAASSAEFTSVDRSDRGGQDYYEVAFQAFGEEYAYAIDALTGVVIQADTPAAGMPDSPDTADGANGAKSGQPGEETITEQEAMELALAQVPGASKNDISEFETDFDDGRMEYEGKIVYDGMEYEFEIDAYSGAFRGWEAEPAD